MRLNFRQGIVRHQIDLAGTTNFIRKNGQDSSYVDLICDNGPIQFAIAHFNANYLFEESNTLVRAWGPLPHGTSAYLYWDVSLLNGRITHGFTTRAPYNTPNAPNHPELDQHWFDKTDNAMKVWNGDAWLVKLRVFAGVVEGGGNLIPKQIGSQVGLSNQECTAGNIIIGRRGFLLRDGDGTFITTESNLIVANGSGEDVKFESTLQYAEAGEYLPEFSLVSYTAPGLVMLASFQNDELQVHGLVRRNAWTGEIVKVFSHGVVSNQQWSWPVASIGKPLFCGINGQITLTPPLVGLSQIIGYVYDSNTIYVAILNPTRL